MPLDPSELAELARAIAARRAVLVDDLRREVARARDEPYSTLAGAVTDLADQAVADLIADLDNAEVARDVAELRELDAADERIAAGRYGECATCGEDIPVARLRANPGAARCIGCQEQHEKTFRR